MQLAETREPSSAGPGPGTGQFLEEHVLANLRGAEIGPSVKRGIVPGQLGTESDMLAIQAVDLEKRYLGVHALRGVDFRLAAGEVRALLGKNGAGKSTLVKIISGVEAPDSGRLTIQGRPVDIFSPSQANALGVATVYQELSLVPELNVAENILLGRWRDYRRGPFIDKASIIDKAATVLRDFGVDIDAAAKVSSLSIAQQQLVEIARGLALKSRVLILDEPTSSLPAIEVDVLLGTIQRLSERNVAVIYVSHRMEEIQQIAQSVTVMRDGRHICTVPIADAPTTEIVRYMTGTATDMPVRRQASCTQGKVALKLNNVSTRKKLDNVSLEVRQGEIVGLAGLLGSGRTELLRAIYGLDPLESGTIEVLNQVVVDRSPAAMIGMGLGLAPEDRKKEGLVLDLSVSGNLVLACLRKVLSKGLVSHRKQMRLSQGMAVRMSVKVAHLGDSVKTLSGGNQQKVVLGKSLNADVKVFLLDEPTRGVDIEAKHQIYEIIAELAAEGTAVIVASSEMEELMHICDRLLMMKDGAIVGECSVADTSLADVMAIVMGNSTSPTPGYRK